MEENLVSVIIPVYKTERYIRKCIDSIIGQTYKNLEIILVDDESPDRSGEICEEYSRKDCRVKTYHKKNGGVSSARNFGMKKATGQWIFFIDSDDWIISNAVEICMKAVSKDSYDICFIGYAMVRNQEEMGGISDLNNLNVKVINKKEFQEFQVHILNRDRAICCDRNKVKLASAGKLYRREFLRENNIVFPEGINNGEDGIFNLLAYRYAEKGICIEENLYYYYQHANSETHRYNPNIEEDLQKLYELQEKFAKQDSDFQELQAALDERVMWTLGFDCVLKYCHKDNPNSYYMRKKDFLNEVSSKKCILNQVKLNNFGVKKRVLFWNIRHKNFLIVEILCILERKVSQV